MIYMTLAPAYGRDYKNSRAVQLDWDNNKDFLICSGPDDGRYINRLDAPKGITLNIRYNRLRSIKVLKT